MASNEPEYQPDPDEVRMRSDFVFVCREVYGWPEYLQDYVLRNERPQLEVTNALIYVYGEHARRSIERLAAGSDDAL